jgi:hypothetical protein
MSDLIWLWAMQMRRIEPYFPLSHGLPRVDDRRIISGIIFVIRNGSSRRWSSSSSLAILRACATTGGAARGAGLSRLGPRKIRSFDVLTKVQ